MMGVCAEVAQLRAERDALLKQRFEVDEREEHLRLNIESAWRSERDEAICERDEARRWWCYEHDNARAEAHKRNWDCFKNWETP